MTTALTKRQQARNEKLLQQLVLTVPGNDVCADCQARNPAWASWSLGIFLCMRCAAIHRKLGTHVSKVKSLSMDSWSTEQVENMRKVGNIASNKTYNPKNQKPPVPIDADEADSAMERFIRQKYIGGGLGSKTTAGISGMTGVNGRASPPRAATNGHSHRRTASSDSDIPPPLPPKNTPSRFGFRSASSIFPLSSKSKRESSQRNASGHSLPPYSSHPSGGLPRAASYPAPGSSGSSPRGARNKASQVFGASVQYNGRDDVDEKLTQLKDMGFNDDKRNAAVLKAADNKVEKAIETLIRMGEIPSYVTARRSGQPSPNDLTAPRGSSLSAPTRTLSPSAATSGLTVPATSRPLPASPTGSSGNNSNPFDMLDVVSPAPPQSSQSTGTLQTNNPYGATNNPFGFAPPQQTDLFGMAPSGTVGASQSASNLNLNQAFQGMSVSPSQPLFPHHTGGVAFPQQPQQPQQPVQQAQQAQQAHQVQQFQQSTFPQLFQAPSPSAATTAAQNYFAPMPTATTQQQQQQQQQQAYNNPFLASGPNGAGGLTQTAPLQAQQHQLVVNTAAAGGIFAANPFTRSPTRIQSPPLGQIPEQSQPTSFGTLQQSHTFPLASGNPYGAVAQPVQQTQQAQQAQQNQPVQPAQPVQQAQSAQLGVQAQFFSQPAQPTQAPFQQQQQQQQAQQQYQFQPQPQQQQYQQTNNPFMTQPAPPPAQPLRHNTASIMALYNMPQLAPQPTGAVQTPAASQQQATLNTTATTGTTNAAAAPEPNPIFAAPTRSMTLPLPATKNPFMGTAPVGDNTTSTMTATRPPPAPPIAAAGPPSASMNPFMGHKSRDSMMAVGMEWTNGRHSPDAFASLSARHY